MSTLTPAIQHLARQLLSGDPAVEPLSKDETARAILVCHRLRIPLVKLAGVEGFSALLSRALAMGARQAPALGVLAVGPDGLLTRAEIIQQTSEPSPGGQEAGVILVGELLELLVTFVGANLTLSLVREAWPALSISMNGSTSLDTEEQR